MEYADWNVTAGSTSDSFDLTSDSLSSSYTFYSDFEDVGLTRVIPTGASSSTGFNDLAQNSPSYLVKYATWAYSASSRHGKVVYANGLLHQWSTDDLVDAVGRTAYLQRYIHGSWQTMLSRKSDAQGRLAVGFIQSTVYQYRWVVTETGTAWGATSASTFR